MKKLICIAIIALLVLTGCNGKNESQDAPEITREQAEMFTTDMTASFDSKYFAIMGAKTENDEALAVVNVFSDMGDSVYTFTPGKVDNFFGVCWEKDTYNIWVLTSDKGMTCYEYNSDEWTLNESASLPEYMK